MSVTSPVPEVGQIVRVRQRLYLVEGLVARPRPQDSTLVELSCIEDDAQGQELDVLWERELDAAVLTGEEWARIAQRGFDPPEYFSAYLNTLRWNCVTSTDASLLQSPFRAGIRLDAYQLEPLRKALRLPRVNLFIADDVGLGKTIEAGLIARELLMRKKVREIVVACPPSMLLQWQEELEQRFGLLFEILDKDFIAQIRRERGFGVNPWTAHSRFLISHRLLIDEAYAGPLRNWLGTFRPGTMLILDEAHHAAPSSGQRYAIDSQITRAIQGLSPRFEHRLFLSATPHNGHSNSFTALLELLDPQRFCRGVKVVKRNLDDVMVRRLKDDLREIVGGFPKRHVVQVDISGLPADSPELRHRRLARPVPRPPGGAAGWRKQAHAECFRPADHWPPAAAVLFNRSLRQNAGGPSQDCQEAVGTVASGTSHCRHRSTCSQIQSERTTSEPHSPRRLSPLKPTPRWRPPPRRPSDRPRINPRDPSSTASNSFSTK